MEMGREFPGSPFFPISRAPHITKKRSRFHNIAFLNALIKISQMGKVMIRVMVIANADAPSAIIIPSHHFDDAIGSGDDRYTVACKNIRSFMDSDVRPIRGLYPMCHDTNNGVLSVSETYAYPTRQFQNACTAWQWLQSD